MTLRFQADVNLNELILRAACRREPALVFHTAAAASLGGLLDPNMLERAVEEGYILVTHDLQTMPRHFTAFITTHQNALLHRWQPLLLGAPKLSSIARLVQPRLGEKATLHSLRK